MLTRRALPCALALTAGSVARAQPTPPAAPPPDVTLSGFVQADVVVHRQSSQDELGPSGELLNRDRFSVPRSRFRVDARRDALSGVLEVDGATQGEPSVRLAEANVSMRYSVDDRSPVPLATATLGLMRIPFGHELSERESRRLFLERSSASRALFPGTYDVGFGVLGGHRFVRYALAAMNGEPVGSGPRATRDPNAAKDLVGRVGIDAAFSPRVRVRAGASALSGKGFHAGTAATKDVLVWRDGNEDGLVQLSEVQAIAGAAATPSASFERFGVAGDLGVAARLPVLGELVVSGEIVRAANLDRGATPADPVSTGRQLREIGYVLGFTQEVTRHAMIGVRYDRYDPDADADEQRGLRRAPRSRAVSTLSLAASVNLAPGGRLIVQYDRNRNARGRAPSGLPASLADDALTVRAQVSF